jgi:hypothetical protein
VVVDFIELNVYQCFVLVFASVNMKVKSVLMHCLPSQFDNSAKSDCSGYGQSQPLEPEEEW